MSSQFRQKIELSLKQLRGSHNVSSQFLRKLNFRMKQLKGFHIISYPILMCKLKLST